MPAPIAASDGDNTRTQTRNWVSLVGPKIVRNATTRCARYFVVEPAHQYGGAVVQLAELTYAQTMSFISQS